MKTPFVYNLVYNAHHTHCQVIPKQSRKILVAQTLIITLGSLGTLGDDWLNPKI
jgi:hypothetical protein